MPIGCYSLVPEIASRLCARQPLRILDVGIGFGMYGAVVRQWVDNGVMAWQRYLVGVEAWGRYRNPVWDLYNLVIVDTIQGYLAKQPETFDFILMTDLIEHLDREEALWVVERLQSPITPGGTFIIGTPAIFCEQGAVHGNEFERHRSLWTADELCELGFSTIRDGAPDQYGMQMLLAEWPSRA